MRHRCPSSDARGLGADRRWRRRRETTCVTLKIQGARTCTRADGYGCIRCSLYRALGLTGLIRLHMPRTACSMYACTEVYLYSALHSV